MVLDRDSKLVRFSYMLCAKQDQQDYTQLDQYGHPHYEYSKVPYKTSLCSFFWRTFVFTPLALLCIMAGISFVLTMAVVASWKRPDIFFMILAGLVIAILLIIGINYTANHKLVQNSYYKVAYKLDKRVFSTTAWQVFVAGVKTLKGKMCPIIELK